MITEDALWYRRGDLVEFELALAGGKRKCRGLVLNTAVLFGRGARQVWILDMDNSTPDIEAYWINRKHIVHEEAIGSKISRVVIGADTILHDNPISFPVKGADGESESAAVTVTLALPTTERKTS